MLEDIGFEPSKNISIGSVRIRLSKPESNTSDSTFPRLYGSQLTTAKVWTTKEVSGDVRKVAFTLDPLGKLIQISDLLPDDVLLSLRYLFL